MFDTIHIRLKGPFCKCMSTQKPSKNAYEIFLPDGERPLTVRCKSCGKALTVPTKKLSGSVVYSKPQPKQKASPSNGREPGWEAFLQSGAGQHLWQSSQVTTSRVTRGAGHPVTQTEPATSAPEPPAPEPEPSVPEPPQETHADTRPAYMKHLGLEEQR